MDQVILRVVCWEIGGGAGIRGILGGGLVVGVSERGAVSGWGEGGIGGSGVVVSMSRGGK